MSEPVGPRAPEPAPAGNRPSDSESGDFAPGSPPGSPAAPDGPRPADAAAAKPTLPPTGRPELSHPGDGVPTLLDPSAATGFPRPRTARDGSAPDSAATTRFSGEEAGGSPGGLGAGSAPGGIVSGGRQSEQPTVLEGGNAQTRVRPAGAGAGLARPFGRYQLQRELGRGGMGVVYEAVDPHLGRSVALKVLGGRGPIQEEERERFLREARICAQLSDPGIVGVYDVGEVEGQPYFTMDLVRGCSLADWTNLRRPEIREGVRLVVEVARAIACAHDQGIVHRDLKPSNILLEWPGGRVPATGTAEAEVMPKVRVTDFGLGKVLEQDSAKAALTVTGTVMGTPAYMPPEQAAGETSKMAAWSDVYSLGAVLYELLVGAPPFDGATPYEVCAKVLREDPPSPRSVNPRLSRDLETIVLKAMEKDPRRRYPTARELKSDLERFLGGEAIVARPTSLRARLVRMARRDPRAALLLTLACMAPLAAALGLLWVVWGYQQLRDRAARPFGEGLRILAEAGSRVEARARFEAANQLDPDAVEAPLALADLDLEEGSYAEAERHIREAVETASFQPTPRLARVLYRLELGRLEEARADLATPPPGERDAPSRWLWRALALWTTDAEVRPPQPGFRWPPGAAARAATSRRPDGTPWKNLRESAAWKEIDAALRVRESPTLMLLVLHALTLDGDREGAREVLARLTRTQPGRPTALAWTAALAPAEADAGTRALMAQALAQVDRPELHFLLAEISERTGDEAGRRAALETTIARVEARTVADSIRPDHPYWIAWKALAQDALGSADQARRTLESAGWADGPASIWPTALLRR